MNDYILSLEDLKKFEWVIPWSGGKDSTATIIKAYEMGIPVKYIYHTKMMFDNHLPAVVPLVNDFIDESLNVFSNMGYNIKVFYSKKTALDLANVIFSRAHNPKKNGYCHGCFAFMRGACEFQKFKEIKLEHDEKLLVGYASDELNRIHRLNSFKQSLLVSLGITENECFSICHKFNLLSPVYLYNIARDGCFFCPNAGKYQRALIINKYPYLYSKIIELIESNLGLHSVMMPFRGRNNWFNDYCHEHYDIDPQINFL